MKPTDPGGEGRYIEIAKEQSEYLTLPARVTQEGCVRTAWELTADEIAALASGKLLHLELYTFHRPLQPIHLFVEGLDEDV